jgi:hypothetical protein
MLVHGAGEKEVRFDSSLVETRLHSDRFPPLSHLR